MEKNKINEKECELCNSKATCLCFICKQYFCNSCYKLIHQKPKALNHKKEPYDPYFPIDINCPEHPNNPLNLFCLEEKRMYTNYIIN